MTSAGIVAFLCILTAAILFFGVREVVGEFKEIVFGKK